MSKRHVCGGNYTLGHIYNAYIEQVTITFNNVDIEHVTIKWNSVYIEHRR